MVGIGGGPLHVGDRDRVVHRRVPGVIRPRLHEEGEAVRAIDDLLRGIA